MDINLIRELVDNENIVQDFEKAETDSEKQLIALLLIRNNLQMIKSEVESISGWMKFFGIIAILGLILSIFF